ncbi:Txe/YoeB family addiction module toxin [Parabacteroides pacaensis]|uniref:Txe/YoeB family addiction module toxin n=1 Tax=Parabacteroides pacaensis TaxID=2086575 RepID=UPI000D0F3CAA|nr:Txe/YoeB family addiction module toxin [Parabacteroides pacaensis]
MKSISRTEFRDNLKKYFELAEREYIIIHKGVKKAYVLMPFSVLDETEYQRASLKNAAHIQQGLDEINKDQHILFNLKNKSISALMTPTAIQDYKEWKATKDRRLIATINKLISEIVRTPFSGKEKPVKLKEEFAGCFVRNINTEHRVVYKVINNIPVLVSMQYLYEE